MADSDARDEREGRAPASAELCRLVLEHTSEFIRLSDLEGRSVFMDAATRLLYGTNPTTLFEFAHPEDRAKCQAWWEGVLSGRSDPLLWRVKNAAGEWRWLETSPALVQYGDRPHVLTICRDVTARMETDAALRRSERMLAEAARIAHVGSWLHQVEEDGSLSITWSDETCRILGLPIEQRGRTLEEFQSRLHPDDRALQEEAADRARRGEAPYDVEYRVIRPDGELRYVHSAGEFTRDESGRFQGGVGIVQDVTRRRVAEDALRESEQRWRHLTEALPQLVWTAAADGACDYLSAQWTEYTGLAESDMLGWRWVDSLHPDDRDRVRRVWLQTVAEGRAMDVEYRVRRHDGHYRPFKVRGVPIRDATGTIARWFGTSTDIADLRQAEAAQRAAESRLRHVVATSPAVLFTLPVREGTFGDIDWISENVESVLGFRVEEALSLDWWATNIDPTDRDAVVRHFVSEILSRDHSNAEYRFRHKDGIPRWIRGETRLLRNAEGEPTEVVGSLSDITERKLLEDQFRQAQKLEAVGTLAGGVAHDFNNLLAVINISTELILSGAHPDDPMNELLTEIRDAGQRAGSLTRQLLAFSRQQVLERRVLNLNAVVKGTEKLIRRLIGEDIIVSTALDSVLAPVTADAGQLEQVLMNLSVNARDAMPQGGTLAIETRNVTFDDAYAATHPDVRPGEYVELSVVDTGTGMDAATKARIFDPFFTTKEVGRGTGLGLAVVHGIVKQSGGHVDVDSIEGRGTAFRIYLPTSKDETPPSTPEATLGRTPLGSETVLLVEDDATLRALTRHVLLSSGYTVLEAADGLDAIRVAEAHAGRVDLLVSDVVMPRLGGRQLAERLVALHPAMKVLFVSGYTDDAVVRYEVLRDEFAFLQKPFSAAGLAQKVRDTLDTVARVAKR